MAVNDTIQDPLVAATLNDFTSHIYPAVAFLCVGTFFSAMTIPVAAILVYTSTSSSLKKPIYLLNLLSISMGWATGILNLYAEARGILHPFLGNSQSIYLTFAILELFIPWISEGILLIRLIAVYPMHPVGKKWFILILTFPVLVKSARIGCIIWFWQRFIIVTRGTTDTLVASNFLSKSAIIKVEWILQMLDNGYLSFMFLRKLHQQGHIFRGADIGRVSTGSRYSFSAQLRALFWIALTNFVFPVILNFIQVIIIFRSATVDTSSYVFMVNVYVSIITTVFATIWTSIGRRGDIVFSERTPQGGRLQGRSNVPMQDVQHSRSTHRTGKYGRESFNHDYNGNDSIPLEALAER